MKYKDAIKAAKDGALVTDGDQVSLTKDEIEEMKLDDGLAIDWDKAIIEPVECDE